MLRGLRPRRSVRNARGVRAAARATPARIARYYGDLTDEYAAYGGDAGGWNYGLWEDGVMTHQQALVRGNAALVHGLGVGPDTRVLDLGCGCGGLATWLAERFGCPTTGITICRPHLALARKRARDAGLSSRCTFRLGDMDRLPFGDESFDVAIHQETFCYSRDKAACLAGVRRVLAPGGVWSASDFSLREGRLARGERDELDKVLRGFHLPSLARPSETVRWLARSGFVDVEVVDLTPLVLPSAAMIMRRSHGPLALARAFPRRRLHAAAAGRERNVRGHFEAGMAYSIGLHTGLFRQVLYRARRP